MKRKPQKSADFPLLSVLCRLHRADSKGKSADFCGFLFIREDEWKIKNHQILKKARLWRAWRWQRDTCCHCTYLLQRSWATINWSATGDCPYCNSKKCATMEMLSRSHGFPELPPPEARIMDTQLRYKSIKKCWIYNEHATPLLGIPIWAHDAH